MKTQTRAKPDKATSRVVENTRVSAKLHAVVKRIAAHLGIKPIDKAWDLAMPALEEIVERLDEEAKAAKRS